MSLLTPNLDLIWQKRPTPGDATTSIALYILQQLQKHWNNTATNATHTNRWCYVFYHTLFNATSATTTLQQHCNMTLQNTLEDGATHFIALYTLQQQQQHCNNTATTLQQLITH